jgi:hypothetical protein
MVFGLSFEEIRLTAISRADDIKLEAFDATDR